MQGLFVEFSQNFAKSLIFEVCGGRLMTWKKVAVNFSLNAVDGLSRHHAAALVFMNQVSPKRDQKLMTTKHTKEHLLLPCRCD
jgi:hypothetical protein